MTDVVQMARERRKALVDELSQLDAFLAQADEIARRLGARNATTNGEGISGSRRPSPITSATYAVARREMNTRGRPVPLADLLQKMREEGVEVGGKDPAATLSARLSNSHEFKSHRGFGWWFSDRPIPSDRPLIEEAGEFPPKEFTPASSDSNQGGSEDAAALNDILS